MCQSAHVARSTFYVYYQNIDELAQEMEQYHLKQINERNAVVMELDSTAESYDFYRKTWEYITDNQLIFHAWMIAYPNQRFLQGWKDEIKKHLISRFSGQIVSNKELILEMIAVTVISIYTYWLQHMDEVNFDHMDEIIRNNLKLL